MIFKLFITDNEFDGTFYRDVCPSNSPIEKGLSQIDCSHHKDSSWQTTSLYDLFFINIADCS